MGTTARTKAEQRRESMTALLTEGRRMFARDGFAAVNLNEVARAAGMTKGALYHHFGSKTGLFRAVVEQVQRDVADRVAAAADAEGDPWSQLLAGCQAFLTAGSDPEVQRIMLLDGPTVLGWQEWRAMDETYSARHLTEALTALMQDGTLGEQPVGPLTRLLSGAMNETALWLAQSTDPSDLADASAALIRLLEGIRQVSPGRAAPPPPGEQHRVDS